MENFTNKIICGDILDVIKDIPGGSIDLVITSPPYNLSNTSGGGLGAAGDRWKNPMLKNGYTGFSDNIPESEYNEWQRKCLHEMWRVVSDNGAIFYNHKWRPQNKLLQDRREIVSGFPVRQIIIWQRAGGINFNDGYFVPTYEVIYMIAKPNFKLKRKANALGDVWKLTQERNSDHPAPFPVSLPYRIISSAENANIILDPFMGSGTTAIAALMCGKNYIGIDNSKEYCEMAEKRIIEYKKQQLII